MSFENLTVVGITGSESYTAGTINAILRSQRALPNSKALLVSPDYPSPSLNIKHIPCKPFSYLEYNLFVLYNLKDVIDTEYCLIVQQDGFVLNGQNWREEFWEYDYIGAPLRDWVEVVDGELVLLEKAPSLNIPPHPTVFEGQNGGFSLRSQKLLHAPSELDLAVEISPLKAFSHEDKYQVAFSNLKHNEDVWLSLYQRSRLEQHGCHFAPPEVASRFAAERFDSATRFQIPYTEIFGCHLPFVKLIKENQVYFEAPHLNFEEMMADKGRVFAYLPNILKQAGISSVINFRVDFV